MARLEDLDAEYYGRNPESDQSSSPEMAVSEVGSMRGLGILGAISLVENTLSELESYLDQGKYFL